MCGLLRNKERPVHVVFGGPSKFKPGFYYDLIFGQSVYHGSKEVKIGSNKIEWGLSLKGG